MKYWDDENKRNELVDQLWKNYRETNDPDYLADMLAIGVFKENGIPDEIAKEMFEWLEALNKHGIEEKNTFATLTEERNEFIFTTYFCAKEHGEFEDSEARRIVQKALKNSEGQYMELDAIRKTIRRHYYDWRKKNSMWCEEKLKDLKLLDQAVKPSTDTADLALTGQAIQDHLNILTQGFLSQTVEGTQAHTDLEKEAKRLLEASENLFKSVKKDKT